MNYVLERFKVWSNFSMFFSGKNQWGVFEVGNINLNLKSTFS